MKFVCTQNDLNTHLSLVSRAVPSRPSHPVLANVRVVADEETQRVGFTAFDLSLGMHTSFVAEVEMGGSLTLPAKLLNDIVSRLPGDTVTLDAAAGETLVTLQSGSGSYQVRGMGAEEFPELPVITGQEATHLPVDALLEGLHGSLFAASTDETKQILTGVHLLLQPDYLEFAATDGHRLAVVQTQGAEDETESNLETGLEVTVPARALRELERLLGVRHSLEPLSLLIDQGQVVFEWGEQRLTSRTLEGQYPAYRQLIPRQFVRQITVDRRLLLGALERIAVLADQKNSIVKFTIDSVLQQLKLSADAQDVGSGLESIPAQVSGENLEIAFNVKYLTDGLKTFTTADMQIQLNTATSPVVLTPLGGLKLTYLVMPVQIRP
ncbi:DNA polymerase III subunit beta [Neosynechococcus sphagnicola sy1]|uniref:Beta sliding clamp n=1 Tax=Neosynechococcus sphagnicola sy1 TaxID=1497020 RepID=A0A098TL00_9CYAN|nr:DNA polymerase III subunit beta [Neosynechococcus sphagnicola]KGF73000.1 DNA polymerase III subunit beta [Neosynechococcus sphagnicola sy1]